MVGSFLNVCIFRLPKKESVVLPASHCMACGAKIKWYDLIPVLSWLFLRGRCRGCGVRISPQYPVVELANGILWTLLSFAIGKHLSPAELVLSLLFCSALLAIAFIDYQHLIIPDEILIFILLFAVIFNIIDLDFPMLIRGIIGFFVISVPLLLISMLTGGGIGGGDIKLMAVCGLFLGYRLIIPAFFFGAVLAGILSALLLAAGIKKRGDVIPLGPFLSAGVLLSMFFGNYAVDWYLSFFI